ncbi:MAG: histidine kinase [Flavobacteriales bacterium]
MERFLLPLLLFAFAESLAQPAVSWSLGTADGLPSSMVYDLELDASGRLWMGTQNGLVYYDGNQIHRPEGKNAVGDRSYISIRNNGEVWCTDFEHSLFTANVDSISIKHTFSNKIRAVQNVNDTVYVLTRAELVRFLPDRDSAEVIYQTKRDGVSAVGGETYKLGDKVEHLPSGSELQSLDEIGSSLISFANNTYYRYFFDVGLVLEMQPNGYDTVCVALHRPMQPPSKLTGIKHTSAGLWVIGYDGAFLVDSSKWFLPGTPVSDVVESESGVHWFATLSDGVIVIPNLEAKRIGKQQGLNDNQIMRVNFANDGSLLACDNGGALYRMGSSSGQVENTFASNVSRQGELVGFSSTSDFTYVSFGELYSLGKDLRQRDKIPLGNFKKLKEDSLGNLIVLSHIRLWRISVDDDGIFNVIDKQFPPDSCRPIDFAFDANNNAWLLTKCNLYLNESAIPNFEGRAPYLLATDDAKNVWCYSPNDSIFRLRNTEVAETIAVPTSMQSEQPPLRMIHTGKWLLLLFNNQLLSYSFAEKRWTRFSTADGLPKTDLTAIDVYRNTIAVSSFDGIYLLPLESAGANSNPRLEMASVLVNGEETTFENQPYKLAYDQRNLEFQFAGISPESRGDITYDYQLNGPAGKVTETSDDGNFKLRSLSEGRYELEVSIIDSKRNRSEAKTLAFNVLPPWYATNTFMASVGVLLFLLGFTLYSLRMRSVRKSLAIAEERNQLLENARTSQLTALRAQLNPHFLFNALNSVQGLFSLGMEEKANQAMGLFSRLMRKLLEFSNQNEIKLVEELEMLRMYLDLEAVRFGEEFNYEIQIDPKVNAEELKIPSLMIQPYVENAVKHGLFHLDGDKRVSVKILLLDSSSLQILLLDNGVGREAAAKLRNTDHQPFGTKANATRLDLLNSERKLPIRVEISDANPTGRNVGTKVVITIPLEDE